MTTARRARALGLIAALVTAAAACTGSGGDHRTGAVRPPVTTRPADASVLSYDRSASLDATSTRAPDTAHGRVEHITYTSFDGATVPGIFSTPKSSNRPLPCVIVMGGFGSAASEQGLDDIVARGYGAFTIDQRNSGARGTQADRDAAGNDPVRLKEMLRGTVVDLRRGLDYLETRKECDPKRFGYLGFSFGGFIGTLLAGVDDRLHAAVLVVSGADWRLFVEQSDALLPGIESDPAAVERAVEVLDPVDPARWVGRISPRPVMMVWGDADTAIPPPVAKALHRAANAPKTALRFHGGHMLERPDEQARVFTAINRWLDDHLK